MTAAATTHRFEAEVQELLGLVIHSLYTEREIFLRELISNASDALDKRRIEGLTDETVAFGDAEAVIRLEPDPEKNTLSILDNGIGMSREEMVQNLGTLARSGTRAFLERLKDAGKDVTLVELSGEDHWLSQSETRLRTLQELDKFINGAIGKK